jgi:hypothetical protein
MNTYTADGIAVVASNNPDDQITLPVITGDYDWWYGEIAEGVWAYVITTEDTLGNVGNPDWTELPELLRTTVLAGLRREVPA